jgi:hypothetical protein
MSTRCIFLVSAGAMTKEMVVNVIGGTLITRGKFSEEHHKKSKSM